MKLFLLFLCALAFGQPHGIRKHTTLQSTGVQMVAADKKFPAASHVKIKDMGNYLLIESNGIPNHSVGEFPNLGNPNAIKEQNYKFKIKKNPKMRKSVTPSKIQYDFGVAVNGVPFDPAAAEWYQGERNSKWQYEALSGAVTLGIDENHAHVQPTGAYHYHGLPTKLMEILGVKEGKPSPLVGYAADGFRIYALYGERGQEMTSSYKLKNGNRPIGGKYDGTFLADYEYVAGSGNLDECNGAQFRGEYAYFLTIDYPVIPRCFRGKPNPSFKKSPPSAGSRMMGGEGHRHRRGRQIHGFQRRMDHQSQAGGRRRGPPQKAIAACESKAAGDSCSFDTPHGSKNGTCFQPPHGGGLACRP